MSLAESVCCICNNNQFNHNIVAHRITHITDNWIHHNPQGMAADPSIRIQQQQPNSLQGDVVQDHLLSSIMDNPCTIHIQAVVIPMACIPHQEPTSLLQQV